MAATVLALKPALTPAQAAARTHEVTRFGAAAVWTGASQREFGSWLEARRTLVTASSMSALLGCDPRRDALDVYVGMVAPLDESDVEQRQATALDDPRLWGRVLEEPIARTAAAHFDWDLVMGGFLLASRKHPTIGATLDAEIRPRSGREWLVYEGKTVSAWKLRDWDEEAGLPPDHILIQAQTQLLVTEAPQAIVFALVGGNRPIRITVEPDPDLHALMVEAVDEHLDRVARLDPPPPTWRSKGAIQRLHPLENGECIQLPREAVEWTRELVELGAKRREIEKLEAEIKNRVRLTIGDASEGELPEAVGGKHVWKCVTEYHGSYTVAASSSRVPRLVKGHTKPAGETAPRRRRARRA